MTSSNPAVAFARLANGKVQIAGIKEGTTTITVNSADGYAFPDSCIVTVYTEVGDLNCDGYVTIADVASLIDYLLNEDSATIKVANADTNKDNQVSIADVSTLIDFLLDGSWPWEESYSSMTNNEIFSMVPVDVGSFTLGNPSVLNREIDGTVQKILDAYKK